MSFSRKQTVMVCSDCGTSPARTGSASGWKACDRCEQIHCPRCYDGELKSASHCTEHSPWGKWLKSGPPMSGMVTFS